jgi:hypothetical protein
MKEKAPQVPKETAARSKASAREAKEDDELVEIFGTLAAALQAATDGAFPSTAGSPFGGLSGLLCLEHLLHVRLVFSRFGVRCTHHLLECPDLLSFTSNHQYCLSTPFSVVR